MTIKKTVARKHVHTCVLPCELLHTEDVNFEKDVLSVLDMFTFCPPPYPLCTLQKEDDATQKASSATPTALAKTQDQLPSDLSKGSDLTSPHLPHTPIATTLSSSVQEITEEKQATDAEAKASQTEGENEEFATLKRKSNVGEETVQAPRDKSMSLTRDASKDTEALSGKVSLPGFIFLLSLF